MLETWFAIGVCIGLVIGVGTAGIVYLLRLRKKEAEMQARVAVAQESADETRAQLAEQLKSSFSELSLVALERATNQLGEITAHKLREEQRLQNEVLDGKKQLINQSIGQVLTRMEQIGQTIHSWEKDREAKFGALSNHITNTQEQTGRLIEVTTNLHKVLSSGQARGQWGERIAEDVLRTAGFIENVNYRRQERISGAGTKPDFTFDLPQGQCLNMDVKFPFSNYVKMIEAGDAAAEARMQREFFTDVRRRVREVASRDYINQEQKTIACVLMFVPNEQIFAYLQAEQPEIMDEALALKVIICSPLTLFAILAVVRQAVENFAIEQTSHEIIRLLGDFRKQWGQFVDKFDGLDQKIEAVRKEFDHLTGVRARQVDKVLRKIEDLAVKTEAVTSDAVTSDAVTSDAVTSDAVTSEDKPLVVGATLAEADL